MSQIEGELFMIGTSEIKVIIVEDFKNDWVLEICCMIPALWRLSYQALVIF